LLFGQEIECLGTTLLSRLRLKEIAPSEQLQQKNWHHWKEQTQKKNYRQQTGRYGAISA